MKNVLKIVGACIAALALGATGASVYTSAQPDVTPTPVPELYYNPVDLVVADGLMFEIKATSFFDDSEYYEIKEGHQLYGICVSITNLAVSDSYFDADSVQVYANGVLCENYLYGENSIGSFYLASESCRQGWIYYLVPENVENIALEYMWNTMPEATILFKLK